MSDDDSITTGERIPILLADHRIAVLVLITVVISFVFTSVGLFLYTNSGTVQIDLSRPDYEGISETAETHKGTYVEYPAIGPINETTLKEFDASYSKQIENMKSFDAFGGDPLDAEALGINNKAE